MPPSYVTHLYDSLEKLAAATAVASLMLVAVRAVMQSRVGMRRVRTLSGPAGVPAEAATSVESAGEAVWYVALFLAVGSVVMHAVFLVTRLIETSVEVVQGFPWNAISGYGFGPWGLWTLLVLVAACAIAFVRTGDLRLASGLWWLIVMLALWGILLLSPIRRTAWGGFARTGSTLLLLSGLSLIHAVGILVVCSRMNRVNKAKASEPAGTPPRLAFPPGFVLSAVILAVTIALIGWVHLMIPVRMYGAGFGYGVVAVVASAVLASTATWHLHASGAGSSGAIDVTLALGSLAVAGTMVLPLSGGGGPLDERFPMIFTALMFGLTLAAAALTWLAGGGRALDSAERTVLAGRAGRMVFLNGVLGLLAAIMMTVWPRLPGIASMDDSLGRVTAGLGANLALLLVMLWAARTFRRITIHALTILVVCSAVGFVATRALPFASRIN